MGIIDRRWHFSCSSISFHLPASDGESVVQAAMNDGHEEMKIAA
jgi:hypothetical protein